MTRLLVILIAVVGLSQAAQAQWGPTIVNGLIQGAIQAAQQRQRQQQQTASVNTFATATPKPKAKHDPPSSAAKEELNRIYEEIRLRLDPAQKEALKKEELAWLWYRESLPASQREAETLSRVARLREEYGIETNDPSTSEPSEAAPDPTDQQALAAFNWLQDQYGRPHTGSVTYSARDDSYHWIGPKFGKPMKMTRKEFDLEVWYSYYATTQKNEVPTSEPTSTPEPLTKPKAKTVAKTETTEGWTQNSEGYHFKVGKHTFEIAPAWAHTLGPNNLAIVMAAVKAIQWSASPDPQVAGEADDTAIEKYCETHEMTEAGRSTNALAEALEAKIKETNPDYDANKHSLKIELVQMSEESFADGDDYGDKYYTALDAADQKHMEARGNEATAAAGPSPAETVFGVSLYVHDAIKEQLNDPDSYKYESHSLAQATTYEGQACWSEEISFRAKNAFGAYIKGSATVYTREEEGTTKVIACLIQNNE